MKYLFVSIISLLVLNLSAQKKNIAKADRYLKKKSYEKAAEYIALAFEDPSTKDLAETYYYRGVIYLNLFVDEKLSSKFPDANKMAEEDLVKSFDLDSNEYRKLVLFVNNGDDPMRYIYSNYFKKAADNFNSKNFKGALQNFINCAESVENIEKIAGIAFPTLDTNLILNVASSSENLSVEAKENKDLELAKYYDSISAYYYTKIVDAKLKDEKFLNIYKWLVYYYYQINKNQEKLDKYLKIAYDIFPDEPYFKRLDIDIERRKEVVDYKKLIGLYKDILKNSPDDITILNVYASDVFSYIHPSSYKNRKRPENFKALAKELNDVYAKLIKLDTAGTLAHHLDLGKHKYNQVLYIIGNDYKAKLEDIRTQQSKLRDLINKYSGSRSSSNVAKRRKYEQDYDKLNKQKQTIKDELMGDIINDAIASLEFVFNYYDSLPRKLTRYEKSLYKSCADLLINSYTEKNMRAKVVFYEKKYDEANSK